METNSTKIKLEDVSGLRCRDLFRVSESVVGVVGVLTTAKTIPRRQDFL